MKISSSDEFIRIAKQAVYEMALSGLDPTDDVQFSIDNVYVVTSSFILFNQKAMLSTTLPDGKYYEVTYNDNLDEMYVDCYVKIKQNVIK